MEESAGSIAAVSLLDKYTVLNTHIDKTRKENDETEVLIEDAKHQLSNLVDVERIQFKHDVTIAEKEIKKMQKDRDLEVTTFNNIVKKEHSKAKHTLKQTTNKLNTTKAWINERRELFLQSSRDFRLEIKRIKIDFLEEGKASKFKH